MSKLKKYNYLNVLIFLNINLIIIIFVVFVLPKKLWPV